MSSQCKDCGEIYTINRWCKPCQLKNYKKNIANWTTDNGNEKIDDLIQKIQIKIYLAYDIIVKWIPYNQFNDIKEIADNDIFTIYSAIWNDCLLEYDNYNKMTSNKKVTLRSLYNSWDPRETTLEFLEEVRTFSGQNAQNITMYGISHNPNTKEYIIVLEDSYCKECVNQYTIVHSKWCSPCQINNLKQNFANWTNESEKINDFILEKRLKIDLYYSTLVEWLPYNQFNDIKEISKTSSSIIYSAIWNNGPLEYDINGKKKERIPNKNVILKYICNSKSNTSQFLYKVKIYKKYEHKINKIYGISQSSDTKDYIMVLNNYLCKKCGKIYSDINSKWCIVCHINGIKQNFASWTSGNVKIDNFIQDMQLKISSPYTVIIEWIPYNQFTNVEKIGESTLHSAIWTEGPLQYDILKYKQKRIPNKVVILKYSYSLNEIKSYLGEAYGITLHPDTDDYILVLNDYYYCKRCGGKYIIIGDNKWCKPCQINNLKQNFANWTSKNEKIDEFIQEMQIKIERSSEIIVEWIPYNQFNNIKEIGRDGSAIIYSAIWKNGQLSYDKYKEEQKRIPNKKVILKCLCNSQNNISGFLDEFKLYKRNNYIYLTVYGISQNPDTRDYIMIVENGYCNNCGSLYPDKYRKWCKLCQINNLKQNFANWTSGNKNIDDFIQEMQLKIERSCDTIVEWIPYNQFNNIKEIGRDDFDKLYSAIWKDGPLYCNYKRELIRLSNNKVILKYLHNIQDITSSEFLNKVKLFKDQICGLSQNPNTKDCILVYRSYYCKKCGDKYIFMNFKWCKSCQLNNLNQNFANWTSGNKKIDDFIHEIRLKNGSLTDIIVEWIPYNQFNNIKNIYNDSLITIDSAIWIDGPLKYKSSERRWIRIAYKKVALKYLYNTQNDISKLLSEINLYFNNKYNIKIYGISQDPYTKDYIVILQNGYCEKCGKMYVNMKDKWCNPCQINNLKQNFTNWTTENEKIDEFIQSMQLGIKNCDDIVVEWIPYNKFNDIKEIGKGGFATVNLAIWTDGPLKYENKKKKWERIPNEKVALKRLYNSQNINSEFLNEVKAYSNSYSNSIDNNPFNNDGVLKIYGISWDQYTKDYIIVLQYAIEGNLCNYKEISKDWYWFERLYLLRNIIKGLEKIHKIHLVHRDFHTGNILMLSERAWNSRSNKVCISDMGLCGEVNIIDETKIYGVMPYMAPEVLRGNPYTQAADIYSFGMIMYFVATGRQPFENCAHDQYLALDICEGTRPEINEQGVPEYCIDIMKMCWDSNPKKRPTANEIEKLIDVYNSERSKEIAKQNDNADEYRKANLLSVENNQPIATHPQAYYTSRLLNSFTKDLSDTAECLECAIND
ncbi:hypothetical protein RclHR1_00880017 [Rhizophagus clarus]|uniref:Protein kinase domain-containing protein n=1 Tax=Rhizophagus clarus TaxID=94130 RepID=A0A2Z6S8E8_9GLOM|nr:hypothetical protein RclHR1_00880017 [Rhizophagus clarus]